jgi:hypothetical protein
MDERLGQAIDNEDVPGVIAALFFLKLNKA